MPSRLTTGIQTHVFWADQFSFSDYRSRQIKIKFLKSGHVKNFYVAQPTRTGNFEGTQGTNTLKKNLSRIPNFLIKEMKVR